jgi:hypothetical protein
MNVGDDAEARGRWMTYGELAEARKIKRGAAIRLVQRHKWRRQAGNDGFARVLVPPEWAKPSRPQRNDVAQNGSPAHDVTVLAYVATLEAAIKVKDGQIATLKEVLASSVALIDGFRRRADTADADRRAAQARAERSEVLVASLTADLQAKGIELAGQRSAADRARAEVREAVEAAEALRRVNAERRARALLARVSAAWRGE